MNIVTGMRWVERQVDEGWGKRLGPFIRFYKWRFRIFSLRSLLLSGHNG